LAPSLALRAARRIMHTPANLQQVNHQHCPPKPRRPWLVSGQVSQGGGEMSLGARAARGISIQTHMTSIQLRTTSHCLQPTLVLRTVLGRSRALTTLAPPPTIRGRSRTLTTQVQQAVLSHKRTQAVPLMPPSRWLHSVCGSTRGTRGRPCKLLRRPARWTA
jgi:hypothetical protein